MLRPVEALDSEEAPAGGLARLLWWPFLAVLGLSLAWRLPSLFDPPWVNDEGTYFAVGQAMAHGYRLYADVWENKPPGIYLLYSGVYHLAGSSLLTIRLLAAAAVALLVLLVFRVAASYAGQLPGLAAALLTGLLMGVPFLEGTTGNAEVFMILCTSLAVYLALVRENPAPAGISMAAGMLFKAVAGFDAAALGLWLFLHRRRLLFSYAVLLLAALGSIFLLVALAGILKPMIRDAILYDLGYVGQANGPSFPYLLVVKLAVLAGFTFALRNRPFPVLWLAYAAVGAFLSGRIFGHYVLQIVPPLAVCFAMLLKNREVLARRLLVALPVACLLMALMAALLGEVMASSDADSILAHRLQYYANFVRYAAQMESYATYRSQLDDHVNRNERLADIVAKGPKGKLLVWGNIPWVYVLSKRLPATIYTSSLRLPPVPGEAKTLRRCLARACAEIVVIVQPAEPPLGDGAKGLSHYRLLGRAGNGLVYERRGEPGSRLTPHSSQPTTQSMTRGGLALRGRLGFCWLAAAMLRHLAAF